MKQYGKMETMEAFLRVEQDRVKSIVDKASPQGLEIIAETIWSLCVKMNVPLEEAEECVRKVKERNMGYLFENMEKMDIQEERRKTKEAVSRAEEAENRAEEAESRAEEAESRAEEAESRAEEAESRAEEAESRAEEAESRAKEAEEFVEAVKQQAEEMRERAVQEMIAFSKQLGASREEVVQKLMEVFAMDQEAAGEKVWLYRTEDKDAPVIEREASERK